MLHREQLFLPAERVGQHPLCCRKISLSCAIISTGVYVISPAGQLLRFIPVPEDYITNTAFGGADMKTLYITAGKTLYRMPNAIAGLPR